MSVRLVFAAIVLAVSVRAAEEPPKSSAREALKARIAEDAKKEAAKTPDPKIADTKGRDASPKRPSSETAAAPTSTKEASTPQQPATVLPKVEVRKERITELDVQIAQQERDIAREQKNTKSSEVDNALNDAKIARPLAIFGGDSTQFRKGVASERVELMEAEKDILEAMKLAKTKEEKAFLQKQLDELRTARRQLDKTLR